MGDYPLSSNIEIDESGRVVLSDAELDKLISTSDVVTSGGVGSINEGCSNIGECANTLNTSSCTNSLSCGGSMNSRCTNPR